MLSSGDLTRLGDTIDGAGIMVASDDALGLSGAAEVEEPFMTGILDFVGETCSGLVGESLVTPAEGVMGCFMLAGLLLGVLLPEN